MEFSYSDYHREILILLFSRMGILKQEVMEFDYYKFHEFLEMANIDVFVNNISKKNTFKNNISDRNILEINAIINTVKNFKLLDESIDNIYNQILVRLRNFSKINDEGNGVKKSYYDRFKIDGSYLNDAQRDVYDKILHEDLLFLSAPTSFGKSFLTRLAILNSDKNNIAILLPTKALVNEYSSFFIKKDKVNLIRTSMDSFVPNKINITIMTYDRFSSVVNSNMKEYDWFVIDEFYNVNFAESASKGLFKHINSIFKVNNNVKMTVLSPYTRNVKSLYAKFFNKKFANAKEINIESELTTRDIIFINSRKGKIEIKTHNDIFPIQEEPFGDDYWIDIIRGIKSYSSDENYIIYSSQNALFDIAKKIANNPDLCSEVYCDEINSLIKYLVNVYGDKYPTIQYLRKGIAIHAGFTDNIERKVVEKLFRLKIIKYIICTTTLIKGVNLNSQFLFTIDQMKIPSIKNNLMDTRNLLGRIGRYDQSPHGFGIFFNKSEIKTVKENINNNDLTDVLSVNEVNDAFHNFIKIASYDSGIDKNLDQFATNFNNDEEKEIDYIHYIAPPIKKPKNFNSNHEILEIIEDIANNDLKDKSRFDKLFDYIIEMFQLEINKEYNAGYVSYYLFHIITGKKIKDMIEEIYSTKDRGENECIKLIKFVNSSNIIYNFQNALKSYYKRFGKKDIELFDTNKNTPKWERYLIELGCNKDYLSTVKKDLFFNDHLVIENLKKYIKNSNEGNEILFPLKEIIDEA